MKLVQQIRAISEFFFYLLGGLLFIAFLFWNNDTYVYQAELFLRYADLPFAFVSLLFAGTTLRLSFSQGEKERKRILGGKVEHMDHSVLDAVLIAVGLLIFLAIVYIDITIPNVF